MWSPTGIARKSYANQIYTGFYYYAAKNVYYRLRQKRTKYNLEKTNLYNRLYPEAQTAFYPFVGAKIKRSKLTTGGIKHKPVYRRSDPL